MLWFLVNEVHRCHCAAWGDTETEAQEARLDCRYRDGKGVCFVDGVYDAVGRDGRRYLVVKGEPGDLARQG